MKIYITVKRNSVFYENKFEPEVNLSDINMMSFSLMLIGFTDIKRAQTCHLRR